MAQRFSPRRSAMKIVYIVTGNFFLGLFGSALAAVIIIKIADWCAPLVQKHCNLPGISLPTLSSAVFFPIGLLGNWILDKIPGINKLNADPATIQKRFGIFGEPMMIGFMLGILLGLLAGYDFKELLGLAINLAAVMYILPRMVRILMDGLIPISDGVKEFMAKRFPDRSDFYIGLDIAVAIGNPAIISTGLVLTPIAILLAFLVPGNQTLPVADLSNMAVFCSMIVVACNQNIVRSIIIAIPCLIGDLLICSAAAPLITQLATNVGYDISASGGLVTAFLDGGNPFRYLIYQVFSGSMVAIVVAGAVAALVFFTYKVTRKHAYLEGSEEYFFSTCFEIGSGGHAPQERPPEPRAKIFRRAVGSAICNRYRCRHNEQQGSAVRASLVRAGGYRAVREPPVRRWREDRL